ncbi:hypothetical protein SDC9_96951 [bioreactor metagenome]|uniref:Uncharacterized protein n=1 Tax=bioreactor metagenome TaxID=1076179 RepID=A0A645AAI4_9ZZZZ
MVPTLFIQVIGIEMHLVLSFMQHIQHTCKDVIEKIILANILRGRGIQANRPGLVARKIPCSDAWPVIQLLNSLENPVRHFLTDLPFP